MLRRRTSGDSAAKGATGLSQLLSQAFQASNKVSSSNPGKSVQGTAIQRLLAWIITPATSADTAAGGCGAADTVDGGTGKALGTLPQAASAPTMPTTATHARS